MQQYTSFTCDTHRYTGYRITKNTTTEHSIPWTRLFEMQRKHLEIYYHMYLSNKYSRMSRLQVCLDMCTQSKITRDVTRSCILTYGHKYSPLRQEINLKTWKLPWLILCPIKINGIIYGKCITFIVCFKNMYIYLF
jgi:hypothetical protein